MPEGSVVMPVFNAQKYLAASIESVLGQSFTDFEFIVVNDASTDGSAGVIGKYHDARIRLIENPRNLGVAASLNRGVAEAKGKYLFRMDADDIALPGRFTEQVKYLEQHTEVALCGTQTTLIDASGNDCGSESYPCGPEEIRRTIFRRNPLAHPSVCIRREVLDACGGYDARFLHNEDYDLWLRIGARHPMANLETVQLRRRIHDANMTVKNKTEMTWFRYRTLSHAVYHYYRNPFLAVYLLRPLAAWGCRRVFTGGNG
jgi:glycosyltransferase involved in cell wall biosynthesis